MKPKNKLPPWLRQKEPPKTMKVGIGWYTEQERAGVKAAAVDSERFEATYDLISHEPQPRPGSAVRA